MSELYKLREEAENLQRDIDNIKLQLEEARRNAAATGIYADSKWYGSARRVLKMKQRQHQSVMLKVGELVREEKRARSDRIENRFLELCRNRLDKQLFSELLHEAQELAA